MDAPAGRPDSASLILANCETGSINWSGTITSKQIYSRPRGTLRLAARPDRDLRPDAGTAGIINGRIHGKLADYGLLLLISVTIILAAAIVVSLGATGFPRYPASGVNWSSSVL
jgi:hypothetical protein